MKKVLFVFAILFLSLTSIKGQTNVYHPFPTHDVIWREVSGGYQSSNCKDYEYYITGDTLIGSFTYYTVQMKGVKYYEDNWGNCTYNVWYYFDDYAGAFRNDSLNKKVYFLPPGNITDTLLYDFDLNIGDSLHESFINNQFWSHNFVSSIDSVLIGNDYRKRFGISGFSWTAIIDSNYVYIIEGIGGTFGLLGGLEPPFERGSELKCFMQNGITVYPDTGYNCELVSIIEYEMPAISNLNISPNPFTQSTQITLNQTYHNIALAIYDIQGKLLKQQQYNDCSQIQLNRNQLSNGLYFLKLTLDDKVVETGKVVISE